MKMVVEFIQFHNRRYVKIIDKDGINVISS